MHQLWNGIVQHCKDRFWWHFAEIFKRLWNRVCMFQFSYSSSLPFNSFRSTGRRRYSATPPDLVPCPLLRSSSVSCFPVPSLTPLLHTRTQLLKSRVQLANESRITWVLLCSLVRRIDVLLYHRCFRNQSFLRSRWLVQHQPPTWRARVWAWGFPSPR